MSELSFLLELLLNHELTKPTQLAIKDRIGVVELSFSSPRQTTPQTAFINTQPVPQQVIVGHTPQAQEALALREQIIAGGAKMKPQRNFKGG